MDRVHLDQFNIIFRGVFVIELKQEIGLASREQFLKGQTVIEWEGVETV